MGRGTTRATTNAARPWRSLILDQRVVQIGDNPGRDEPTTGEINYRNVFRHIHGKGFDGILGMEHGNSRPGRAGELAVIDAYRRVDVRR